MSESSFFCTGEEKYGYKTQISIQRSLFAGVGLKEKAVLIVLRAEMRGSTELGDMVWMRVMIVRMTNTVAIIFKRRCDSPLVWLL